MPDKQEYITRDDVNIPLPTASEENKFDRWLNKNDIKEPFHLLQHYDYVSAFRAGINRKNGHFPDIYKLPEHPTFSIESIYYKKGMPSGKWEGEKYIPIDRDQEEIEYSE